MRAFLSTSGRALMLGLAVGTLAACAGGGGGDISPPTSPPPTSPPPPPPPPSAPGGSSTSGGTIFPDAARERAFNGFKGAFRGPRAGYLTDGQGGSSAPHVDGRTSPGDLDDFVVVIAPGSDPTDQPTVTVTLDGEAVAHNFSGAVSTSYSLLGMSGREKQTAHDVDRYDVTQWSFDAVPTQYSALLGLERQGSDDQILWSFATVGADVVIMPASGSASFETGVFGRLNTSTPTGRIDVFGGTGVVSVDFGSGAVTGVFPDVDWSGGETSSRGLDFGLSFEAQVTGDDFAGAIFTTNGTLSLEGEIEGDFYGPAGSAPQEIGAAFALEGKDEGGGDAFAIGGMLGTLR